MTSILHLYRFRHLVNLKSMEVDSVRAVPQGKGLCPRKSSFIAPRVNPFIHRINLTFVQKIQVVIMSLSIAPLRFCLCCFSAFLTWALGLVLTYSIKVGGDEPVGHFHLALLQSLRWMGRLVLFFCGFHNITVRGTRASATSAPIMVSAPHSTWFDCIICFVCDPLPSVISRFENSTTPFIGTLVKALQPIYVYRENRNSRKATLNEIARRARSGGKWPQLLLYPEGTCTNRKALISFKTGAFAPGVPVQPVALRYLNSVDTLSWTWSGPGHLTLLWLTLCQFETKCEITYLPVYTPDNQEMKDPKLFANNVRNKIADVLDLPCTGHTFEDCRLMRHATDLNLPMEAGLVEFTKISRKLGMDIDSIYDHLSEFAKIAQEQSSGRISINDFAKFLRMPVTPALEEMFSLYDRDETGKIDFREYVIGLSLVSQPAVTNDTVQLAFKIFDKNGDGMISKDEFSCVLHATFGSEFDSDVIFDKMHKTTGDELSYEDFFNFVQHRPEYAKVFLWYKDMRRDDVKQVLPDSEAPDAYETFEESGVKDMDSSRKASAASRSGSSDEGAVKDMDSSRKASAASRSGSTVSAAGRSGSSDEGAVRDMDSSRKASAASRSGSTVSAAGRSGSSDKGSVKDMDSSRKASAASRSGSTVSAAGRSGSSDEGSVKDMDSSRKASAASRSGSTVSAAGRSGSSDKGSVKDMDSSRKASAASRSGSTVSAAGRSGSSDEGSVKDMDSSRKASAASRSGSTVSAAGRSGSSDEGAVKDMDSSRKASAASRSGSTVSAAGRSGSSDEGSVKDVDSSRKASTAGKSGSFLGNTGEKDTVTDRKISKNPDSLAIKEDESS